MRLHWRRWVSMGAISERAKATLLWLPLSWSGLGALVLGVMLARWSWVLLAPHAAATAVVPESGAAVEAVQLFGAAVSSVSLTEVVALPNVRLMGVFAAETGRAAFAVLKLDDNRQLGIAVGESMASGAKLLEVHPDYVLLEHVGVQQRVNLERKVSGGGGVSGGRCGDSPCKDVYGASGGSATRLIPGR